MLHVKFQDHRTCGSGGDFLKVFTIYGQSGHLGHATWPIYKTFEEMSCTPKEAPHKIWF